MNTDPNLGISDGTLPFVHSAWETVKRTLDAHGSINHMAILINRENAALMFVPPTGIPSKEHYAKILALVVHAQNEDIPDSMSKASKTIIKEMIGSMTSAGALIHPDLVVHMSEAWMVTVDFKQVALDDVLAIVGGKLQEHPKREEVVVVGWKSRDGEIGHQVRLLKRDEAGTPALGDYVINDKMGNYNSQFLEHIFVEPVIPASKKN